MNRILILLGIVMFLNSASSESIADENEKLLKLFDQYDEYIKMTYPEGATYDGDHRYDDKVSDNSEEAVIAGFDSLSSFLNRLEQIDYGALSSDNKLNYDLFRENMRDYLDARRFQNHLMPVGQQYGIQISLPQLVQFQPLDNAEDYNKYFTRLRQTERLVNNDIANMKKGMSLGIVMPDFIMEKTLPQFESIINKNPKESVFFQAMEKGKDLTDDQRISLSNELSEIIVHDLNPSLQRLHDFIMNEYIPSCRKEAGVWSLPDGAERYNRLVKDFTTLDLTFEDVHRTGLEEVERILLLMQDVKNKLGYEGTVQEFNRDIKKDTAQFFTNKEDLMNQFRQILSNMDRKLPELFGKLPQAAYDLKEMEEFRARSAPQAYYYSAPEDRSRPGYFYVNTYDLASRPKYTMTALALHEAVPGHHLQISIAQELKNLPKFRRDGGYTVFVEGWALYAESLGYEAGMYDDLYQLYGALIFEMWRACRLVVDTGIHGKKWSRQMAVDYMKKYTANSDLDIESEVDRYIAWPGQALSYKTGELKIKEIRSKAEKILGDKFDVREFHDKLLENGALSIPILEKKMDEWLASKTGS